MRAILLDVEDSADTRLEGILKARSLGDAEYLTNSLRDPENRHLAALFLGDLGATEALPDLRRLLLASDPLTRANAARALGKLRDGASAPSLLELAVSDPEPFVRGWAVGALGNMHHQASIPALLGLLSDSERQVRVAAAHALSVLGVSDAMPAIRAARKREGIFHIARRRAYTNALRSLARGMGAT